MLKRLIAIAVLGVIAQGAAAQSAANMPMAVNPFTGELSSMEQLRLEIEAQRLISQLNAEKQKQDQARQAPAQNILNQSIRPLQRQIPEVARVQPRTQVATPSNAPMDFELSSLGNLVSGVVDGVKSAVTNKRQSALGEDGKQPQTGFITVGGVQKPLATKPLEPVGIVFARATLSGFDDGDEPNFVDDLDTLLEPIPEK